MTKNGRKLQIIVKFQKLLNMVKKLDKFGKFTTMYKKCQKRTKNEPKRPKNGQIKKQKKMSSFSGSKLPKKCIQWAETSKNGFKCFKMHSNTYYPKRAKKWQKQ